MLEFTGDIYGQSDEVDKLLVKTGCEGFTL